MPDSVTAQPVFTLYVSTIDFERINMYKPTVKPPFIRL